MHAQGPGWAEVTEGTGMGWERERYSWDAAAGTVTIDTLDSNLWGPGSGWHYELVSSAEGTDLHVSLTRRPELDQGETRRRLDPHRGGAHAGEGSSSRCCAGQKADDLEAPPVTGAVSEGFRAWR